MNPKFHYRVARARFDMAHVFWAYLTKYKVKVKLSLCLTKCHAMKTCWGSGDVKSNYMYLFFRQLRFISVDMND